MPGASNIPGRPHIYPMPDNPLALLRTLHELLKVRACFERRAGARCFVLKPSREGRLQVHSCMCMRGVGSLACARACSIAPTHHPPASPPRRPHALQLLVDQLRQKCLEEPRSDDRPRGFSALTQDPKECVVEVRPGLAAEGEGEAGVGVEGSGGPGFWCRSSGSAPAGDCPCSHLPVFPPLHSRFCLAPT